MIRNLIIIWNKQKNIQLHKNITVTWRLIDFFFISSTFNFCSVLVLHTVPQMIFVLKKIHSAGFLFFLKPLKAVEFCLVIKPPVQLRISSCFTGLQRRIFSPVYESNSYSFPHIEECHQCPALGTLRDISKCRHPQSYFS